MIYKSNGPARRILTSPAVHPCEAIAPSTLLNSLINLAGNISDYRAKFFASNKRSVGESIRQIGVLRILLEELRNECPNLPDSWVLGLSELHLVFQKLQYLVEDCTREGARLWILMKSERVANQFRVLTREISTVLDVLPLHTTKFSVDIKENVELLMRQSRKARFEVEPDDKAAINCVISVLNLFKNGIVPDRSDLSRVLDYLGIRGWGTCNKEVKFLDSEIALERMDKEKREVGFLSSLMGFMCYCRCVLFDVIDGAQPECSIRRSSSDVMLLSCLNPDDFRCPISLEFMIDPVTVSTGHTYDRSSILKWFRAGNTTCPKTGQKLPNSELVPNMALRKLIQQYCSANGMPIAESGRRNRDLGRAVLLSSESLAAEKSMKMVASFLAGRLETASWEKEENRNRAAYEVRVLSKTSIFNRSCLAEAGTIPSLLKLVSSSRCSSSHENAMAALLNLSKHLKSRAIIFENGGLELVVDVLSKGVNQQVRQHAAGVLFYLASIEAYRQLIGEIPEAIPGLMELIKDGTDRGKKNALVAIFGLLMHPENHSRVLAAGAVPVLVNLLESHTDMEDLVADSLAILATLAEKPDGTTVIMRSQGALHLMMEVLDSSAISRAGKEYCLSVLLALCINAGADVVALLVKSSSLMESLYSLLSEGTSRASKKASALIRVLHNFSERSPILARERFVHVR
ncbi:U-box domain-containing protein 19 [Morella rubra]|uniref:RING-type E3 ubiquitin transferase n=1 Tax=Morella rubra TaxID=262757 RepID=A0A6A1V6W5_9ROSI|nr:U-box domain-containing protein 19 [Morella rubra]